MIQVQADKLSTLMLEIFSAKGLSEASAQHCVHSIVQTSLRGVDSHGIKLFPHYCRALDAGRISKQPHFTIEQRSKTAAVLDADHAFGHHAGAAAMAHAIATAKEFGIGAVAVKNASHFGAAAYFALPAAAQDCIGWSFTNADALVKAHSGKAAYFGTNPICFTAPMAKEEPYCLDMATSTVSWNKIKNYRVDNAELEPGWAFDDAGQPVTDPHLAASLRPVGDYKGFGLGMMVDILCGLLSGGLTSPEIEPMFTSPLENQRRVSHFFMAFDINGFTDPVLFKQRMQHMADEIRAMEAVGEVPMLVAGDPEKASEIRRLATGIPVPLPVWEEFLALDARFNTCVQS